VITIDDLSLGSPCQWLAHRLRASVPSQADAAADNLADFLGRQAQIDSGRSHAKEIALWFDISQFLPRY